MPKKLNEYAPGLINYILTHEALRRLGFIDAQICTVLQYNPTLLIDDQPCIEAGLALFLSGDKEKDPDFLISNAAFSQKTFTMQQVSILLEDICDTWNASDQDTCLDLWGNWHHYFPHPTPSAIHVLDSLARAIFRKGIRIPNLPPPEDFVEKKQPLTNPTN